MNWDQIEGKWKEFAGAAKEKWGKLTDNEWTEMKGKRDKLTGVIQQKYGVAKEEAEKQIKQFEDACKC
ncbi:MAG: CsbD family protein [Pirellulaceae bacterium]|nr:CsbD family protein [Pirellulaceae bacterium]